MQIESYRTRIEEFEQRLNRELLRLHSGLHDRFEIVSLYADYSDLFCSENIREIETALKNEPFESRRKTLEKILVFLLDQYFDFHIAPVWEEIANSGNRRTVTWEGMQLQTRQVLSALRVEPDALKRRKLHEKLISTQDELAGLQERKVGRLRLAAAGLGFKDYIQARERIIGYSFENLLSGFEESFRRIEGRYLERIQTSFETSIGIPLNETGSWDVAYWEERNDCPGVFSQGNLARAVQSTIDEAGIRPENADSISLDMEKRDGKQIGALCIPIRIPQQIMIVLNPGDGARYYAALLHEFGHACHFAWTAPSLPPEHRIIGDRALAEGYGFLLEHLLLDRDWLARTLLFPKSEAFLRFQALYRIFLIRRCMGRLRFSLSLCGRASFDEAPQIYSETMHPYTGLRHIPESWPGDLDENLICAEYLRGWALEAMLSEHLRTRFGKTWYTTRGAAGFLKEIWETGLLYRADELSREIGMGDLDPQVLVDQLWEGLQL